DCRLVRCFQHPLLAERGPPCKRLVLIGQMLELYAQGAHFRSAIEAQQFAPFSRRMVAERLQRRRCPSYLSRSVRSRVKGVLSVFTNYTNQDRPPLPTLPP